MLLGVNLFTVVTLVVVIRTHPVARKREEVLRRRTLALEYGGCRKDYFT